jgi:hypothetical protein
MRTVIAVLAAVSAIALAPAWAEETPAPATPAQSANSEVICHTLRLTGSRIPTRRVCKTQSEWNQMEAEQTSGAMTDNPAVTMRPGRGLPAEGAARTPGN